MAGLGSIGLNKLLILMYISSPYTLSGRPEDTLMIILEKKQEELFWVVEGGGGWAVNSFLYHHFQWGPEQHTTVCSNM